MRNKFCGNMYNGYDLSITNKNDEGFYVEILQALENLLKYMTEQHGRLFFIRFDVRYPANSADQYPSNNDIFSNYIESLTRYYKRHGHDSKYLWVRELSPKTGQFHYHVVLLLDSNLIQTGYKSFLKKATELWQLQLGIENGKGLVEICKSNGIYGGIKIIRSRDDFNQAFEECFQRASYLAKCYSKGHSTPNVNEYGCSRIPKGYLSQM